MITEDDVRAIIQGEQQKAQYSVAMVPSHEHNGIDSPKLPLSSTEAGVSQIVAGTNVTISPAGGTGVVTVNSGTQATGVTSAIAGTAIAVSAPTGAVTITNIGVTSLSSTTGITLSSSTGAVVIGNSGVTSLLAGTNVTLSSGTGAVTISATGTLGTFATISGTDSLSLSGATSPNVTTHTITHGLGVTPRIVSVTIPRMQAPLVAGVGPAYVGDIGWLYFDKNGNAVGGIANTISFTTGGGGTESWTDTKVNQVLLQGTSNTSGGTGLAQITLNNFTATTFDIVYSSSVSLGTITWNSGTINWAAMG